MKVKGKGQHPNSKQALEKTKWKKGQAVPGAGRPKGALSLKERLLKFGDLNFPIKMPDGSIKDQTLLDAVVVSLYKKGCLGDVPAIKEIFERVYGKETQSFDIMTSEKIESTISMEERIKKYAK